MMKQIKKHKLLLMSLALLVFLTACRAITDQKGQVFEQFILKLDTPFSVAWNDGLFTAFLVYPISLLLNYLASIEFIGAGGSIIIVTLLFNALLTPSMIKQQIMTQKQQIIQPELNRITAKYEGKTDQQSMLRKNQEMQALFAKHQINPLGSLLPLFLQMPLLFAMYGAIQRSYNLINGSFFGIRLNTSPSVGVNQPNGYIYIIILVFMIITNIVSFKLPQYLTKLKKRQEGIKDKAYANVNSGPNPEKSLNTMMYVMLAMTSWFGWSWPVGMALYWGVGSLARIAQSLYIYKYHSLKG